MAPRKEHPARSSVPSTPRCKHSQNGEKKSSKWLQLLFSQDAELSAGRQATCWVKSPSPRSHFPGVKPLHQGSRLSSPPLPVPPSPKRTAVIQKPAPAQSSLLGLGRFSVAYQTDSSYRWISSSCSQPCFPLQAKIKTICSCIQTETLNCSLSCFYLTSISS